MNTNMADGSQTLLLFFAEEESSFSIGRVNEECSNKQIQRRIKRIYWTSLSI